MNKIAKVAGIGTVLASSALFSATHAKATQSKIKEPTQKVLNVSEQKGEDKNIPNLPLMSPIFLLLPFRRIKDRKELNHLDCSGYTPVHNAILAGDYKETQKMINYNKFDVKVRTDVNAKHIVYEINPSKYRCPFPRYSKSQSYITLLLHNCGLSDCYGRPVRWSTYDEIVSKIGNIVSTLVDKAVSDEEYPINENDTYGWTDAMALIHYGFLEDAKKYINNPRFDISNRTVGKGSPILMAVTSENIDYDTKKEFVKNLVDKALENPYYSPNDYSPYVVSDVEALTGYGFINEVRKVINDSKFNTKEISDLRYSSKQSLGNCIVRAIYSKEIEDSERIMLIKMFIDKAMPNNNDKVRICKDIEKAFSSEYKNRPKEKEELLVSTVEFLLNQNYIDITNSIYSTHLNYKPNLDKYFELSKRGLIK